MATEEPIPLPRSIERSAELLANTAEELAYASMEKVVTMRLVVVAAAAMLAVVAVSFVGPWALLPYYAMVSGTFYWAIRPALRFRAATEERKQKKAELLDSARRYEAASEERARLEE